jgi:ketosteroid isomerase-like protein
MVVLRSSIARLVSILAVAACASPEPAQQPVDLAADADAIRQASMAWLEAVRAKDYAAAAANFASDGVVYHEHAEPSVGPAAVQARAEAEWARMPNAQMSWTVDNVVVAQAADMALEQGTWTFSNEGEQDTGKYITVWKKVDGAWKVAADMGVSTTPEPADSAAATPADSAAANPGG